VDFVLNDLSLHGQYHDASSFRDALRHLMQMRAEIERAGLETFCHRGLLHQQVQERQTLQQSTQLLSRDERSALLAWLTRHGPFWDDVRTHGPSDWLEYNGEIVTDTSIGEAAFVCFHGGVRHLLSFSPSRFEHSPIRVDWIQEDERRTSIALDNFWSLPRIHDFLANAPRPVRSWRDVEAVARRSCGALYLAPGAFEPLARQPFAPAAAGRLLVLFDILDRLQRARDAQGHRTAEGHEIYRNFFTGKKGEGGRGPLFTDSSDSEKAEFNTEFTFPHPERAGQSLFCSWHGKTQTPQLRIHFSWPSSPDTPLYITYVGPKISKR